MTGINEKIERHVAKKRRAFVITAIASSVIAIPILCFMLLPNLGSTSQTTGVVKRVIGLPTDEGQNLYLLVELDNGDEVRSFISNSSLYHKNRKVKLEKQNPLIFGRPVYIFRGYTDNDA